MRILLAALAIITLTTCTPKVHTALLSDSEIIYRSVEPGEETKRNSCRDALAYAPDTANPSHQFVQEIRVNFHIMDSDTGVNNFGLEAGRAFVHSVLKECNHRLQNNIKMLLPPGNNTPVLPASFQMVLAPDPSIPGDDGIYFQNDEELYYYIHGRNTNRTSREVIKKHAIQPETVVNVFLQPHHPDSLDRPDYNPTGVGIMLGTSIKISQIFSRNPPPLSCVGLLTHEMGHVFGLSHTWRGSDGCDDTPAHSNCWDYTKTAPCDTFVSNNLMDYNKWQWALTPCQIGRVHRNISDPKGRVRNFVNHQWCTYDPTSPVVVKDDVVWEAAKDVKSDILIEEGASLEVRCRLSLPKGAKIIVAPGARLILNDCELGNTCGDQWHGIVVRSTKSRRGTVEVIGSPAISDVTHNINLISRR